MHCAACSNGVERSLKKVPGVDRAEVNLATQSALVRYDENQATIEQLEEAVTRMSFGVIHDAPGVRINTGEGTSTTPNNNGAGTHQPSNTQANGTENELSRTGVAVTGVAGIMMLLALAGISLNLWKVRR